jgi:amidase
MSAMRIDEYLQHDATALAAAVAGGQTTAAQLLETALAQHAHVHGRINAVIRVMEREARAQLAQPLQGPLAGVPFLIKDAVQDYAGLPTSYGSRSMQRVVPPVHSAIVRRFLGAGLVIFGKTNTPEFALKGVTDPQAFGRSCNPWNLAHTPGGSSGGAAAAVAAGVVPMAAGNDGGGSIRIPAACCGLFGLRPSRGRVSVGPAFGEVWNGASSDGVLSRSVRDGALALDVLAGAEPGDPFVIAPPAAPYAELVQRAPRKLRIGFSTASPIGTPVHDEAVQAVQHTARLLQRLGHDVVQAAPRIDGAALATCYLHLYFGQIPAAVAQARAQGAQSGEFELLTRVMAVLGRTISAETLTLQLARWNEFARALGEFHRTHDVYLTPTLAHPPVTHSTGDPPPAQMAALGFLLRTGLLGLMGRLGLLNSAIDQIAQDNLRYVPFTQLANLTGTPAMSVPLHWCANGLPLGVQFIAPAGDEATLLQLAAQLEAAQPWFDRLAPLARERVGAVAREVV